MVLIPIIALILLFGMLTGTSLFAFGACTFLLLVQLARTFSERWSESIIVERHLDRLEINLGESIPIGLRLTNKSGYYIPWLFIEDNLSKAATKRPPVALEILGKRAKLYHLSARQPALMTYQLRGARRGYYQIGPSIIETGDLLGFHRSYKVVAEPQYLVVLPKLIPMTGLDVTSRRPMGDLRMEDRGMEDPTVMAGIRQYQPGDPINRIHWKATARTGMLHTRVFEPTCLQGIMLLLDMHRSTNPDHNEPMRTDLAVTTAASIAHTLYLMGQPFGLVTNGRDAADRVRELSINATFTDRDAAQSNLDMKTTDNRLRPLILTPDRGPEHFAELHRTLARLERTDGLRLPDLISESENRLPRMLSVLAIVQDIDDNGALALGMLRRRGFAVTAIVNHVDEGLEATAAKLAAYHIPVFALRNEDSVPYVCRELLMK